MAVGSGDVHEVRPPDEADNGGEGVAVEVCKLGGGGVRRLGGQASGSDESGKGVGGEGVGGEEVSSGERDGCTL